MSLYSDPQFRDRLSPELIIGQSVYETLGDITPSQPPDATLPQPLGGGPAAFYHYHEGDLFFPGGPSWVLDQKFENPLMCIWGRGLLLKPNRGFQAYPEFSPMRSLTLPRVATPWGTSSPGWSVPVIQEPSQEAQDTATFQPLALQDFAPSPETLNWGSINPGDY